MAKYQPKRFAAVVLHVRDPISTTTCLVFSTGKLVVVGALSWYHALYAGQMYRRIVEKVVCPYRDAETNAIVLTSLEGRTKFENWDIYNIVARFVVPVFFVHFFSKKVTAPIWDLDQTLCPLWN